MDGVRNGAGGTEALIGSGRTVVSWAWTDGASVAKMQQPSKWISDVTRIERLIFMPEM